MKTTFFPLAEEKWKEWYFLAIFLTLVIFPSRFNLLAQNQILPAEQPPETITIDVDELRSWLRNAPKESEKSARSRIIIVSLPLPDGQSMDFQAVETPILIGKASLRYPDFKTYTIRGIEDETVTGKLTITSRGVDGIILMKDNNVFIEPVKEKPSLHEVYFEKDGSHFVHKTQDILLKDSTGYRHRHDPQGPVHEHAPPLPKSAGLMIGADLRQYRLQIVAKKEYAGQHSNPVDSEAQQLADVTAAITATVNGLNAFYERDLAIRLTLPDPIIFLSDPQDNFGNSVPLFGQYAALATEAVDVFGKLILNEPDIGWDGLDINSFDIGHVFGGLGGNGSAYLGVVCDNGSIGVDLNEDNIADVFLSPAKGGGGTQSLNASGSGWFQLVAHEIGHQFDAPHTFNGAAGNCGSAGQYFSTAGYEPGSGVTIMSYRGICAEDNILEQNGQPARTSYFHINSIEVINTYITNNNQGEDCVTLIDNANMPPVADADPCNAGTVTIPVNTPFELRASGSDTDAGDVLTYSWEQYDLGLQGSTRTGLFDDEGDDGPGGAENGAPLFRSYPPNGSPIRSFPDENLLLSPVESGSCSQLLLSEIAEDNGSNQCIEIFNPTAVPIDLGSAVFWIGIFENGSSTLSRSFFLNGIINPYETFTVCDPGANIPGLTPDQLSSALTFDGNDAIALIQGTSPGIYVDIFGEIGATPPSGSWAGISGPFNYVRKAAVGQARSNNGPFNPFEEWIVYFPTNFFIGSHVSFCGDHVLGEGLPQVARNMTFRVTTRDGKGGVDYDERNIVVSADGPFTVNSPAVDWTAGNVETLSWNTGGFTGCNTVNILLSTDGGVTFPYEVATGVDYANGSWTGQVPSSLPSANNAILKVECADNDCATFFNITEPFVFNSGCQAGVSIFSPDDPVFAPVGDPILNLALDNFFVQPSSQFDFDVDGSDPLMNFVRDEDLDGIADCEDLGFVVSTNYESYSFIVTQSGSYTFSKTGGFWVMSIFEKEGFVPNDPCASYIGSNAIDDPDPSAIVSSTIAYDAFTVNLSEGVEYLITAYTFASPFSGQVTFSGPGDIEQTLSDLGPDYAYTFVAIDNISNLIVAQSATADFTSLPAGNYTIKGVSHLSSIMPSGFLGKTTDQILMDEGCLQLSSSSKTLSIQAPLPVELLSFKGYQRTDGHLLEWITTNEVNNKGFEVERSMNGLDWGTIGTVGSKASGLETYTYEFLDDRPVPGHNYYRLRQVDYDGTFEYSPIISLFWEEQFNRPQLSIFPNPTTGITTYQVQGISNLLELDICDHLGRTVLSLEGGLEKKEVDLSNLENGVYYLTAKNDAGIWSEKIVLLK